MTPFRLVTLQCTRCDGELEPSEFDGVHVQVCSGCRGTWMPTDAFWALLHEHQPKARVEELLIHNDGSPRHRCPQCKNLMDHAWLDFLQLDTCEPCGGLWLEPRELDRALASKFGHEQIKWLSNAHKRKNRDD